MIPQHVLSEIESPLFAATLGVVSTPRAFDTALLYQPAITYLIGCLSNSLNADSVVDRLTQLLKESTDLRYCHQHDLAIGVYLRVLDICVPEVALEPARLALRLRNLWWGKVMATRIATSYNRVATSSHVVLMAPGFSQIFVQSRRSPVSCPMLPGELCTPSHLPGIFNSETNAGFQSNEFSVSSQRVVTCTLSGVTQ